MLLVLARIRTTVALGARVMVPYLKADVRDNMGSSAAMLSSKGYAEVTSACAHAVHGRPTLTWMSGLT